MSVELDALPATWRTARFPRDHTSWQVSHPRKGRVPREELGTPGQDGGPATVPCQGERARVGGPMPMDGFSRGQSGLRSAWVAKSLALSETPPPCPEAADLDRAASTL